MSENEPNKALVDAALQAWDKHDLNDRADTPRAGALLLFKEASEILDDVCLRIFELDGVTEAVLSLAHEAVVKTRDAYLIAAIDPLMDPEEGMVERLPGEGYRWRGH